MFKLGSALVGMVVPLVAACSISTGPTLVVLPVRPAMAGARFGHAASARVATSFVAQAGMRSRINTVFSLEPNCTSLGNISVRVLGAPVHGTLEIRPGDYFPNYAAPNPRFDCDTRPSPGVAVFYTPAPGFTGNDSIRLDVIPPSGTERLVETTVVVK